MAFVPEGRCDRSLARSAWQKRHPKEPSRRVRYDRVRRTTDRSHRQSHRYLPSKLSGPRVGRPRDLRTGAKHVPEEFRGGGLSLIAVGGLSRLIYLPEAAAGVTGTSSPSHLRKASFTDSGASSPTKFVYEICRRITS